MTWEWKTRGELIDLLRKRGGEIRDRAFNLHHNERADTFRGLFVTMATLLSNAANELVTATHDEGRLRERAEQHEQAYQLVVNGRLEDVKRYNERLTLRDDKINELLLERGKFKEQIAVLWTRIRKLEASDQLQRSAVGAGTRNYFED